ncbi:MAG: hypothetical protein WBQ18_11785 [Solirubrobacteraceae bacterium]
MRAALLTAATAAVTAVVAVFSGPAWAASIGPGQIARALARAERSSSLWATVNICNSRRYPDALGVRGQMPALGFAAQLTMNVRVGYWSGSKRRFIPIQASAATNTLQLGRRTHGLQQDGAVFTFRPHTGLLNATITFSWTRAGKILGQVHRRTTGGHPGADFGSPPKYSAAQCRIP